jgi:hypothetical protein
MAGEIICSSKGKELGFPYLSQPGHAKVRRLWEKAFSNNEKSPSRA